MTTRKRKKEAAGEEKQPGTAPAAQASKSTESGQISEDVVFIGQKPVMSYVMACMTHLNQPDAKRVVVKARGRAICRAVDTIEVLRRAFVKDAQLESIAIYTEEVTREQDRKSNVSAIKLTLIKP
jgi:DNA-binding protein